MTAADAAHLRAGGAADERVKLGAKGAKGLGSPAPARASAAVGDSYFRALLFKTIGGLPGYAYEGELPDLITGRV